MDQGSGVGWIRAVKKQEEEGTPDFGSGDGDMACQQNGGGRTDLKAHLDQCVGGTETSWELGWGRGGGGAVSGHRHTHQHTAGDGQQGRYPAVSLKLSKERVGSTNRAPKGNDKEAGGG